jgi:hypothetical protein
MVSRVATATSFFSVTFIQTMPRLVQVPLEMIGMIARRAMPSDMCSLSPVQGSWLWIAQSELFRNVRIVTILQSQHFVNAFICNIGYKNPRKGHSHVPLESFVQNIFLDMTGNPTENRPKFSVILRNFCTIGPILANIRTLYIKIGWDEVVLRQVAFLKDLIPPLHKLSIQVFRPPNLYHRLFS